MDLKDKNYKVLGVRFELSLAVFNAQGQTDQVIDSQPILVCESSFFPGLREFLVAQGFEKGLAPVETS